MGSKVLHPFSHSKRGKSQKVGTCHKHTHIRKYPTGGHTPPPALDSFKCSSYIKHIILKQLLLRVVLHALNLSELSFLYQNIKKINDIVKGCSSSTNFTYIIFLGVTIVVIVLNINQKKFPKQIKSRYC